MAKKTMKNEVPFEETPEYRHNWAIIMEDEMDDMEGLYGAMNREFEAVDRKAKREKSKIRKEYKAKIDALHEETQKRIAALKASK